ncbi:K(lysine) acetyltransferase [Cichlidogyrus casuarinus]|uniref:Histone acetyltransferase n=1 Tax=Cichlidogyrus casuarinus TaxID=1844966 RepID=A0ABD2QFT6_9PLAT
MLNQISVVDGCLTRNKKRRYDEINAPTDVEFDSHDTVTRELEEEHREFTRVKFIDKIQLGKYEIDTWYFSPYPEEYRRLTKLWICEFCLKYMRLLPTYVKHVKTQCRQKQPPGKEIYRKGNICVYEIDGAKQKLYCQNLCLLAKLFLDHKTLYYDVTPFMFYVLCELDKSGSHVVGYFSKEKVSADNNNLACILTLPPFQRKGYGRFLISLSYELAKVERLIGSPEKPLSDLGRLSYRSYWEYTIFSYLYNHPDSSLSDISSATCISTEDVIWTLQGHRAIKYWRHGRQVDISRQALEDYLSQVNQRKGLLLEVDRSHLKWTPPPKNLPSKSKKTSTSSAT